MRRECERAWAALGTEDRLRKKERNTIRQAESGDVDGGLPDANQLGRLFDPDIESFFCLAHHCSEIHQTSTCRGNESNSAGECGFPRVESRHLTSKPSHLAELVDQIHESRSLNVTAWHPAAISHRAGAAVCHLCGSSANWEAD